jgi:hypothetical protein
MTRKDKTHKIGAKQNWGQVVEIIRDTLKVLLAT